MNAILFMLHLFGLAGAFAASIGNMTVLQLVRALPGDAPTLGKVTARLARVGQTGLALLWLTGIIMVWTVYGGPENLPWMFWVKFLCVVVVTAAAVLIDLTLRRLRAGDTSAAARLPMIGMTASGFLVLVVIFAVLAFYPH
jgi:hypothetical protein